MRSTSESLDRDGYVVLRSLLENPKLSLFYRYAILRARRGTMDAGDAQVADTPVAYGDLLLDGLLGELRASIERASGRKLYPTYSYLRVYKRGDVLAKHKDRAACELSLSVTLGQRPDRPWPLWIDGFRGPASVELEAGDALLYRGIECAHWRREFSGSHCAQAFFHYVERDGPNAHWRLDKRRPSSKRTPRGRRGA